MSLASLLVQIRTSGANQLRNLSNGFRQASQAGRRATAQMRGDFDRAVVAMNRANAELAEMRREFNRAPSLETARALNMAAMAARMASRNVDDLADQLRQANRAANSLAGRMAAVAAAAMALGSDMSGRGKLMAGLITGLVSLAPLIGAALQGAIIAGLGSVGLGAAIFAAFKDEDIKQVWKDLFAGIGADIKNFAKQLGPSLTESATSFRRAWGGGAADFVRNLFGDLSTTIGPLTQGLIGMAREAGPGLKQAFAAAVPVLKELAALLPTLGRGIGSFFSSVSSGDAPLKGIRVLVYALAGSLMILGKTVQFLGAWFSFWSMAAEKVYTALGKIPLLGAGFKFLAEVLGQINAPAEGLARSLVPVAGSAGAAAQASRDAAAAMQELHNKMTAMISAALGADQANLAFAAAMRALTESVKENGRNLDINTEKGHANVSAILSAVAAAEQKRQADIAMAGGEKASADAVRAANAAFQAQIGQLEAVMRKLGFTQAEIDALLAKYREIPRNITTTITTSYRVQGAPPRNQAPNGPSFGFAAGTPKAPPGWAWTGEHGPELINFRGGETVLNHRESMRRATAGGYAGGGVSVGIGMPTNANRTLLDAFIKELRIRVRTQGRGSVQTLLGSSGRI